MAISLKNSFKSACEKVGQNNNPVNVVVAIAIAKGVFRPLFTMMDKKESPEAKKYTALREGLTEVIAVPTYLACDALAAKGASFIKDPEKAKIAKQNLRFIGVCVAASLVIPALCLVAVNRFEKLFTKKDTPQNNTQQKTLDVTSFGQDTTFKCQTHLKQAKLPTVYPTNIATFSNSGMRVG